MERGQHARAEEKRALNFLFDILVNVEAHPYLTPEEINVIVGVETAKYLELGHEVLFHEVNAIAPTGQGVYVLVGFHPERIILTYLKGAGFKQVMDLRQDSIATHSTADRKTTFW